MLSVTQAILTALLSGIFSGLILFGLNDNKDRKEKTIEKLEQAFTACSEWFDSLWAYYHRIYKLPHATWDEVDENEDQLRSALDSARTRALMLLHIYSKHTEEVENQIGNTTKMMSDKWSKVLELKGCNLAQAQKVAQSFGEVIDPHAEARRVVLRLISSEAKALASRPSILPWAFPGRGLGSNGGQDDAHDRA